MGSSAGGRSEKVPGNGQTVLDRCGQMRDELVVRHDERVLPCCIPNVIEETLSRSSHLGLSLAARLALRLAARPNATVRTAQIVGAKPRRGHTEVAGLRHSEGVAEAWRKRCTLHDGILSSPGGAGRRAAEIGGKRISGRGVCRRGRAPMGPRSPRSADSSVGCRMQRPTGRVRRAPCRRVRRTGVVGAVSVDPQDAIVEGLQRCSAPRAPRSTDRSGGCGIRGPAGCDRRRALAAGLGGPGAAFDGPERWMRHPWTRRMRPSKGVSGARRPVIRVRRTGVVDAVSVDPQHATVEELQRCRRPGRSVRRTRNVGAASVDPQDATVEGLWPRCSPARAPRSTDPEQRVDPQGPATKWTPTPVNVRG